MELDKAIEHAESKVDDTECGQEHKQLAEWLKELKRHRDNFDDLVAERVIEIMNSALELDPAVIYALVEARVSCNQALADHPTIQVSAQEGKYKVGLLGILNGLAGTQTYKGEPNWGRITAVYQVICPSHGHIRPNDGLVVGDSCVECGRNLELGPLECFRKIGSD